MHRARRLLACLGLGLGLGLGLAVQAQMSIPGSFAVSPTGAATYNIPIQVPPGLAGIEPKLALVYNSQTGNGQLGVGWGLAGLSAITRCPQTIAQDGKRTGVNFTSSDRFCLDGKRLVLKTGTYGDKDSTYGTEIESFVHVTKTVQPVPPEQSQVVKPSFKVQTREGLTMEYGNTDDSRIQAGGKAGAYRVWALNKVTDVKGNYLSITYEADTTNGSYHPLAITYTANDTSGSVVSAASKVSFAYDATRPDVATGYLAGTAAGDKFRLNAITTSTMVDGTMTDVLSYKLAYESGTSTDTGRSRLLSVQLCNAKNSCLPKTEMKFPPAATTVPGASTAQSSASSDQSLNDDKLIQTPSSWLAIDINGDGKVDLAHVGQSAAVSGDASKVVKNWISDGDKGFRISTTSNYDASHITDGYWSGIDSNGDSIGDMVHLYTVPSGATTVDILLATCLGTGSAAGLDCSKLSSLPLYYPGVFPLIVDFDGDGLADVLVMNINANAPAVELRNNNSYIAYRSKGDGTFVKASSTRLTASPDPNFALGQWKTLDVDGDGLMDLVQLVDNGGKYCVWRSAGNGSFAGSCTTTAVDLSLASGVWLMLDVNGDGLQDLVHPRATAGAAFVWLSRGDGSFAISSAAGATDTVGAATGSWQVVDYNGDGWWDLVHLADASGGFYVWKSNGAGGFTVTKVIKADDKALTTGAWKAVSLRGDGVVDLVHLVDNAGKFWVWNMPRPNPELPDSINNGLGAAVSWTQQTLPQMLGKDPSSGGSYIVAAATPYPAKQTTVVPAQRVVAQTSASDGLGGVRTTGYNYYSARMERNGRGFVGFEATESVDGATRYASRTTYRQTFPYLGLVSETAQGTSQSNYKNLSHVTNIYKCFVPLTDASNEVALDCSIFSGKRFFPYVSQTDTEAWDLDGSPLPKTTTTLSDFDGFGNAKTVLTKTLNGDGSATDYSKKVSNTYYSDATKWLLGRLVKSEVTATGPDVAAPVVPGSGAGTLPPTPAPKLPPQLLMTILQLLLDD